MLVGQVMRARAAGVRICCISSILYHLPLLDILRNLMIPFCFSIRKETITKKDIRFLEEDTNIIWLSNLKLFYLFLVEFFAS